MFHLLDKPELLSKLRAEILTVFPDSSSPPSLATLEKLPYLIAVGQEGNVNTKFDKYPWYSLI